MNYGDPFCLCIFSAFGVQGFATRSLSMRAASRSLQARRIGLLFRMRATGISAGCAATPVSKTISQFSLLVQGPCALLETKVLVCLPVAGLLQRDATSVLP